MLSRRPLLSLLTTALLSGAGPCLAAPGDALSDRIVITPATVFPLAGTTEDRSVEPSEINEAALPAHPLDQSVWYEWTAAAAGAAKFTLTFPSASFTRGFAAYTPVPGDDSVTMARLQPAGALVLPAGTPNGSYAAQLWAVAGQKFIIRVWSGATADGLPAGSTFQLSLAFKPAGAQREYGDTTAIPQYLPPDKSSWSPDGASETAIICRDLSTSSGLSSETPENLIGGSWYPAGCVQWLQWKPRRTESYRFSLTDELGPLARVMVVQVAPNGQLVPLSVSGQTTVYSAVLDQTVLVRVAAPYTSVDLKLLGGPAQDGDEPSAPRLVQPGTTIPVQFEGASPTRLPGPNDNTTLRPDVWLDLGSNLAGGYKLSFQYTNSPNEYDTIPDAIVTIYRVDPAGNILALVTGGKDSPDNDFFAEPGQRYMARVIRREDKCDAHWQYLKFIALDTPPPNDRRETAPPLPPEGPILIFCDATNATAEESDWTLADPAAIRSRTLWYALDRPASAERWYVRPVGSSWPGVGIFQEEEDGTLVPNGDPFGIPLTFELTGRRIWFMVTVSSKDPRFILTAGPAVTPNDSILTPAALTPGQTQFHYAGASSRDNVTPAIAALGSTMWFSWTAQENGLVCFSTLGTLDFPSSAVFTDALQPVTTSVWMRDSSFDFSGTVTSFQAVAGTSYRISVGGSFIFGPAVVRLQPGGWSSPYQVWTMHYPAWGPVPSLQDPLADTDSDGAINLFEMACATRGGLVQPDDSNPWTLILPPPSNVIMVYAEVRNYALQGPPGCIPFLLAGETTTDLKTWTSVFKVDATSASYVQRGHNMATLPGPTPKYFRMRIYR